MAKLKIAILISGRGSNMQALIAACAASDYPAETALVISNEPAAAGLAVARAAAIPTQVINHRDYDDRASFEKALDEAISAAGAELVCLAGFMRLLTDAFVVKWRDRLINIHPSLMPAFRGLNTHERVLRSGVRFTGCTVHFVRADMDEGPIINQAAVAVHPDDTVKSLAARVLAVEHRAYPAAVRLIAEDRARVRSDVVMIDGAVAPEGLLINPVCES